MSPEKGMLKILSSLTLSVFNSSGWYIANYSMQQTMSWGKNEGCRFIRGTCGGSSRFREFCSESKSCSFDFRTGGHCKDGTFEGNCKVVFPVSRGGKTIECTNDFFNIKNDMHKEKYGYNSSCIISSLQLKESSYVPSLKYK